MKKYKQILMDRLTETKDYYYLLFIFLLFSVALIKRSEDFPYFLIILTLILLFLPIFFGEGTFEKYIAIRRRSKKKARGQIQFFIFFYVCLLVLPFDFIFSVPRFSFLYFQLSFLLIHFYDFYRAKKSKLL